MLREGVDRITAGSFEVTKRTQSRESRSKKDLPAEIWSQCVKTSDFTVLALKESK